MHPHTARRPPMRAAALAAGAFALYLPAVAASQAMPRQHGIFLDSLEVNLVNIEVVVTRDGQPVTDLGRRDFEILDDGEPVEITNFYRVTSGRRVEEPVEGWYQDPALDEMPHLREPITVIVVVDQLFISPASRKKVFAALRQRLGDLFDANAQVMVVLKDSQVKVEQPLTTDRRKVIASLDEIEGTVGSGVAFLADTRRLIRNVTQSAVPGEALSDSLQAGEAGDIDLGQIDAQNSYFEIRNHAQQLSTSVRRSADLLSAFLGSLAGLEGRKAVLYVADTLPRYPGEALLRMWFEKYGAEYGRCVGADSVEYVLREFDTQTALNQLSANANASRVTFYPVSAQLGGATRAAGAEFSGALVNPGFASFNDPVSDDGLTFISAGTGGAAATGSLNTAWIVDRLRRDLSNYYSLGYPAPHRGDDRSHDVEVRVLRDGVEVRHLRSYRDTSPDQQMRDRTIAALLHDRLENPLGVRMALGDGEPAGSTAVRVPLAVRIPLSKLVLVPQGESRQGQISLFIAVRDELGRFSEPNQVVVPIRVGGEMPEGVDAQNAVYATQLLLRPGAQTIAVGVRDDVGRVGSAISRNVLLQESG